MAAASSSASASALASPRTARQLVDALTAHLSLYHASNPSSPSASASPSPRAAILRWLAALPPPARAAACTALLPPSASAALLSMLRRLRLRGHSSFFVLADPAPSDPSSPTVLSHLSRGLLVRAAAASRVHDLLFARALLFTATPGSPTPDSLTLAEPLLADLDAFVAAMDEISGGAFLNAVSSGAGVCPTRGGPARRAGGKGEGAVAVAPSGAGACAAASGCARGAVRPPFGGGERDSSHECGDGVGECGNGGMPSWVFVFTERTSTRRKWEGGIERSNHRSGRTITTADPL